MQQLVVISAKEDDTMPAGVFEARTFLLWGSSANHCATTLAQSYPYSAKSQQSP